MFCNLQGSLRHYVPHYSFPFIHSNALPKWFYFHDLSSNLISFNDFQRFFFPSLFTQKIKLGFVILPLVKLQALSTSVFITSIHVYSADCCTHTENCNDQQSEIVHSDVLRLLDERVEIFRNALLPVPATVHVNGLDYTKDRITIKITRLPK